MSLLSAGELGAIQAVAQSGMTGTADVWRRTTTVTDNGQESTYTLLTAGIACWIKEFTPISGTLGAIAGAVGLSETFSIRVPVGTDVLAGDHLVIGSLTYNVESTSAQDSYPTWINCSCRAIE